MSKVKIKSKKRGVIDVSSFSTKRRIEIDVDDLKELVNSCNPKKYKKKGAPTRKVKDNGKEKDGSSAQPYEGEDGRIVWDPKIPTPPIFESAIKQIKGLYRVGKEVTGYRVTVYLPRKKYKGGPPLIMTIPPAGFTIAIRVILSVGGREHFMMKAGVGAQSGTGSVTCFDGESFSLPIGANATIECFFNNKTLVYMDSKRGHRKTKIPKDPSKTYVCIIDGLVDTEVLGQKIKNEAIKLSKGNKGKSQEIERLAKRAFGVNPIGQVASIASNFKESKEEEEEDPPELVPIKISPVEQVVMTVNSEKGDDLQDA